MNGEVVFKRGYNSLIGLFFIFFYSENTKFHWLTEQINFWSSTYKAASFVVCWKPLQTV